LPLLKSTTSNDKWFSISKIFHNDTGNFSIELLSWKCHWFDVVLLLWLVKTENSFNERFYLNNKNSLTILHAIYLWFLLGNISWLKSPSTSSSLKDFHFMTRDWKRSDFNEKWMGDFEPTTNSFVAVIDKFISCLTHSLSSFSHLNHHIKNKNIRAFVVRLHTECNYSFLGHNFLLLLLLLYNDEMDDRLLSKDEQQFN
jgi:hypothetical protein